MDIGSLVECVKKSDWSNSPYFDIITPEVKVIYTVRSFWESPGYKTGVYLEEIINKEIMDAEPSFEIECFREVLPPMDILAAIENEELILI